MKFALPFLIGSIFTTICAADVLPLVINTWNFSSATGKAWDTLQDGKSSIIDALVAGCQQCEVERCDGTVGYGGSPDENGETTLDAFIFDGTTMNMGAVGALRDIKNAIGVAKSVLEHTSHSFLVGSQATDFAKAMGFKKESLSTASSINMWNKWKQDNCQPNFWTNVHPDSEKTCGPYRPLSENDVLYTEIARETSPTFNSGNHDTIGMVIIDSDGKIVAGTSTNGARNKIPGRVGDSPIPGAGAYADSNVGGAAATGDGDVMMRFLPSFLAVEELRRGRTPLEAGFTAMQRIAEYFPKFFGGIIVANKQGEYAAACNGMPEFSYSVRNEDTGMVSIKNVKCSNS